MLLSDHQLTPVGLLLLALALWLSGVWVVTRRGWTVKAVGGVLLLGAVWMSGLLITLLLMYRAAREEGSPPPPNLAPAHIPSRA
jgi:thiol:disulfide interchange protein